MHLAELAAKLVSSLETLLTRLVEPIIVTTQAAGAYALSSSSSTVETAAAVPIIALIVAFDEVGGWGFTPSCILTHLV